MGKTNRNEACDNETLTLDDVLNEKAQRDEADWKDIEDSDSSRDLPDDDWDCDDDGGCEDPDCECHD